MQKVQDKGLGNFAKELDIVWVGVPTKMWTSQMVHNPKRCFIGCPNFKDKKKFYEFFNQMDDDFTERDKDVIYASRNEKFDLLYQLSIYATVTSYSGIGKEKKKVMLLTMMTWLSISI